MNFFSEELSNVVTIRDQMQYFYLEMTRDEAKSNLPKGNLFAGIQFKHVKGYLIFILVQSLGML